MVRDVLHVHARQVRSLWRTETKKNSVLTSLWVCQSSSVSGAKLAALKTFYGWVARVASVCIRVHPGIVIRGKKCAAVLLCRTTRSLQELLAGNCHPDVCERRRMRAGVEAHGVYHPFACVWPAGCLAVETMQLQGQTFCCGRVRVRSMPAPLRVRAKVRRSQETLGGRARPRGLHRSEVQ